MEVQVQVGVRCVCVWDRVCVLDGVACCPVWVVSDPPMLCANMCVGDIRQLPCYLSLPSAVECGGGAGGGLRERAERRRAAARAALGRLQAGDSFSPLLPLP